MEERRRSIPPPLLSLPPFHHPPTSPPSTAELRAQDETMKRHLALITSFSFLLVGCCHHGGGCFDPATGLVHSGPRGLFDNCGTGICKQKACKCRAGCKRRCRQGCRQGCDPCCAPGQFGTTYPAGEPMIYGDGVIHEGLDPSYCPSCGGHHSSQYPELMVPHGEMHHQNSIVPAPAAESEPDSQTYIVPTPTPSHGLSIPPVSYAPPSVYQPAHFSSVPPIETSAF
jgi:hypothetical protein